MVAIKSKTTIISLVIRVNLPRRLSPPAQTSSLAGPVLIMHLACYVLYISCNFLNRKTQTERMDVANILHMNAGNRKYSYANNSTLQVYYIFHVIFVNVSVEIHNRRTLHVDKFNHIFVDLLV